MGVRRQNKTIWTEELIVEKLRWHFLSPSTVRYHINGLYVFSHTWESDYLSLTKSGYLYEGEVKISKSDFKADFKKKDKHTLLQESYNKIDGVEGKLRPHYFFYAVPENLITEDEVPEYAGLVYMTERFPYWKWVKQAPLLHKEKFTDEKLNLQEKFYYNMVSWKDKALTGYKKELEDTKKLLKEAKTDEKGNKYPYTLGEYKEKLEAKEKELVILYKNLSDYSDELFELRKEMRQLKRKIKDFEQNVKQ